jgi:hypothetical protein
MPPNCSYIITLHRPPLDFLTHRVSVPVRPRGDGFRQEQPQAACKLRQNWSDTVTESQKNNLNPKWKKFFEIDWFFESKQELDIQIYDQDTLNDDDFLGSVLTSVGVLSWEVWPLAQG